MKITITAFFSRFRSASIPSSLSTFTFSCLPPSLFWVLTHEKKLSAFFIFVLLFSSRNNKVTKAERERDRRSTVGSKTRSRKQAPDQSAEEELSRTVQWPLHFVNYTWNFQVENDTIYVFIYYKNDRPIFKEGPNSQKVPSLGQTGPNSQKARALAIMARRLRYN